MIKQSRIIKNSSLVVAGIAAMTWMTCGLAATNIVFGDEDPAIGTFQVSNQTSTFTLNAPFLCADVGIPLTHASNKINPVFAGATVSGGNFQFGKVTAGLQAPVGGLGSWNFSPSSGLNIVQSDPALVCYSLSASGVRKATVGLFSDAFDLPQGDANIAVRTVQLPNSDNSFVYRYYVDVNIPVLSSAVSVPFVVRDGYDSSVFGQPGSSTFYCAVNIGVVSCNGQTLIQNNIDIGASSLPAVNLPPNTEFHQRFIVSRQLKPGVTSLPVTSKPLVLAAVFLPTELDTKLDNNIAAGFTGLSDFLPTITTTGTNLNGLVEGSVLTNVSVALSDDSNESVGQLLHANVAVDFNGVVQPAANVDCGSLSPQAGPGASRTCTFDVVPPDANFATDTTPGTYAAGVHASVIITATDSHGQASVTTLPLHVASSDNDAPVFDITAAAPVDVSSGDATLTCSLTAQSSTPCVGVIADVVSGVKPGPSSAVDELAAQQTYFGYIGNGSLACTDINLFALNGRPRYVFSGSHIDLDYSLKGTVGATRCNITVADNGTLPPNQAQAVTNKYLWIVVTP
jgi:hypothetical protein